MFHVSDKPVIQPSGLAIPLELSAFIHFKMTSTLSGQVGSSNLSRVTIRVSRLTHQNALASTLGFPCIPFTT